LHKCDGARVDLDHIFVVHRTFKIHLELLLFSTSFADFGQEMKSQSFKLVPNRYILLEVRLQLFELFLFEDKLRLSDGDFVNFVILLKSHQELEYNACGQQFKQGLQHMYISSLAADLDNIVFAVTRQVGNYFHCYFRHIKELVVTLFIPYDRNFKELIL